MTSSSSENTSSPENTSLAEPARVVTNVDDALVPGLEDCAMLLDIDGTLLELAPTPSDVVVPPGLADTLQGLLKRTGGAFALVSGRSLNDIDMIFAPMQFPAVGGHGAEIRLKAGGTSQPTGVRPMDEDLKSRFAAIAGISDGILIEDKGYSLALHFRLAPHAEKAIYQAVSTILADLPEAPVEVLPGKSVCEIKPAGFTKASAVKQLMLLDPFKGRTPIFLGDDVTDETVFAIMPDLRGLSFSVGRHAQGVAGHFENPRDVRAWLARLLAAGEN